jgi:PAS domain S-box-containing protein
MLKPPPSLKQRAAAFFFITVVVFLSFGGYLVHFFSDQFRQDIATRNFDLAHHIKEHINVFLEHHVAELQELKLGISQHGLTEYGYMREELDHINAFHPLLELVQILDANGYVLQVSPFSEEFVDIDMSGHSSFKETVEMSGPEVHWSDSFISPRTNDPAVTISLPLEDGVLMAHLNLKELSKIVTSSMPSERETIVITDRRGVVIAHPDQAQVSQAVSFMNLTSIRSALQGKVGSFSETWHGTQGLSSVTTLESSGWVVAVFQSDSQSLGIMYSARRIVIAAILSLMVITVGAFLVLQRIGMRPFLSMARRADMIAAGNYGEDLDCNYKELSDFVNSFNRMARSVKAREEDLSSSEERFRNLFDEAADAVFILDDSGKVLRINQEAALSLGYDVEEIVGSSASLFVENLSEENVRTDVASVEEGQTITLEGVHRRKDGKLFPVETKLARMTGIVGGGIIAYVRDISTRVQAESDLRKRERQYRLLADNAIDVIWTVDMDLHYTYVSPSVEKFRGFTIQEVLSSTFDQVVTADSAALTREILRQELEKEKDPDSDPNRSRTLEIQFHRKGGSLVWGEVTCAFLRNDNSEIIGIQGVTRDITERKIAEDALKDSEERFKTIITNAQAIIFMTDRDGTFLLSEGKGLSVLGLEPGQVVGQSAYELYADYPAITQAIKDSLKGNVVFDIIDVDGIFFDIFYSPYNDVEGNIIGTIGMAIDITKRKRSEEALARRDQMAAVGEIASGIAHEINNPLATISASTEALLARIPELRKGGDGKIIDLYEEYLNMTNDEVERSGKIMRDLLDFARMRDYKLDRVDVNELINDTVKLFSIQSRMDDYDFRLKLSKSTAQIPGDRDRLRQVLVILLSNAVESMPDGGTIGIEGSMDRKKLLYQLRITDDGPGFGETDLERIFEPFFTTRGSKGGTGLGLSIADTIVAKHGGHLEAINRKSGGAMMTVYLPMEIHSGEELTGGTADALN